MNLDDYKNGKKIFELEEYLYNGVRFLYKKGSTNKLFTFFSSFALKGQAQQYNYLKLTQNKSDSLIYFLDSDSPQEDPRGTYFLGGENFGYLASIKTIISTIAKEDQCVDSIYYYGSSKGGSGALLAGMEVGFGTVLVNAPQVKIYDYIEKFHPTAIEEIGLDKDSLNNLILSKVSKTDDAQLSIYITCGIYDKLHLKEHLQPLFSELKKCNLKATFLPVRGGHTKEAIDDLQFLMSENMNGNDLLVVYKKILDDICIDIHEYNIELAMDLMQFIPLLMNNGYMISIEEYISKEKISYKAFTPIKKKILIKQGINHFHEKLHLDYDYKYFPKVNNEKLLVLFNGAIDRKISPPPVFQRSTWVDDFNANVLIVNDPTLTATNDLNIGWYVGNEKENAQYYIVTFLKKFIEVMNFKYQDVLLYGSSAGGFASMIFALHLKVPCVVNNPQVDVLGYDGNFAKKLITKNFNNMNENEFREKYQNRINVVELFKNVNRMPKIYYLQNILDMSHYKKHYSKVIDLYVSKFTIQNNFNSFLYSDDISGHNALGKSDTVIIVNSILEDKTVFQISNLKKWPN